MDFELLHLGHFLLGDATVLALFPLALALRVVGLEGAGGVLYTRLKAVFRRGKRTCKRATGVIRGDRAKDKDKTRRRNIQEIK